MLKRNVKILKYIKSHPGVTCEALQNKFNLPELDTIETILYRYITITGKEPYRDQNGDESGENIPMKNSKVLCNDAGTELIEVMSAGQKSSTISLAIAVAGLIKSFDSELILLAEQIWNIIAKLSK